MRSHRFLALALATPLLAAAADSPALNDVIALPEFKVFESRPLPVAEKWDYVRVGNFEILSSVSARTTKQFARDLRDFQDVLGIVAPHMLIRAEQPVMVVLCGRNNQFDRFAVKKAIPSTRGNGTSLVRDGEIASILVDYQTRRVAADAPMPAALASEDGPLSWFTDLFPEREIHTSEEFIRQYIHLSLAQLNPRPPAWVAEGLANIYANIDYNNKWIEIGQTKSFLNEVTVTPSARFDQSAFGIGDSYGRGYGGYSGYGGSYGYNGYGGYSGYGSYGDYGSSFGYGRNSMGMLGSSYTYTVPQAIMPLDKMFGVDYTSPLLTGRTDPDGRDRQLHGWKRQVTAFVHLCLYGENGKYRPAFVKFVTRATQAPATEAMFKECFGLSYSEMALNIRSYTEFTNYTGMVIKATKGSLLAPNTPIALRPANDAEIGRIKGETFRLAGLDEDARREFVVAYLRGERDPQLLASLGLMARQRQDAARAKTYLEAVAATSATVPRPRAYLELSRLRAEQFTAAAAGRPLTSAQTAAILEPLLQAQRLPQQLSAIYYDLAGAWDRSSVAPTRDQIALLESGLRLFPYDGRLLVRVAALMIKHGYRNDIAPTLQRALDSSRDAELKDKVGRLLQSTTG